MSSVIGEKTVEVLLATHNGERFLGALLDSLLDQSERGFTVLASDDQSRDGTLAILERCSFENPGFLRILEPAGVRLGASANFGRLLDAASADTVFFCDQDDVWLPRKIADSLLLMREAEAAAGDDLPVLVHTGLAVVDSNLAELSPSFARYVGINPARNGFAALLLGNIATGCTVLANRALYGLARPIPPGILMFDHWLAQVAAATGRIAYLDRATILYRQHDANVIGSMRKGTASVWLRVKRILFSDATLLVLLALSRHAALLIERYGTRMDPQAMDQARTLATLWARPRWRRFGALQRAGLRKPNVIACLGLFVLLLRNPPGNRSVPVELRTNQA